MGAQVQPIIEEKKEVEKEDAHKQSKKESPLTELYAHNIHIRTVYHMLIGCWILFLLYICTEDYLSGKKVSFGLRYISIGFQKLDIALIAWTVLFLNTCMGFVFFRIWACQRIISPSKVWDILWICILVGYYIVPFIFSSLWIVKYELPHAPAAIVTLENVRLLMKLHAFVRGNVPKIVNYKSTSKNVSFLKRFYAIVHGNLSHDLNNKVKTDNDLQLPTFSHFLYFLFIPKLVYRDSYPKTESRDWTFIFSRLLEIISSIFCIAFVFEKFLEPSFADFGKRPFSKAELLLKGFQNCISGFLFMLSGFLIILHSWQNLFGELLRFPDRALYGDWWNCTNFADFFKKWNKVVHHWLVEYIYKDVALLVDRKSTLPKWSVFFVSAIVHEWVITFINNDFFPLCTALFFLGMLMSMLRTPNKSSFNVIFLIFLALGYSIFLSLYTIEYFAKKNLPPDLYSQNNFLPRFINCDWCIKN